MDYRPMIDFYVQSRVSQVSISTANQSGEKVDRVFRMLESYGVQMEDDKIEGLTPPVLQRWYNDFAKERKMATLNNYVSLLNPFLRWAQDMGYLDCVKNGRQLDLSIILKTGKIPSIDTVPPEERPKDKYYTHEQTQQLLSCEGRNLARDRAIMILILDSGLRVEEVCSMNLADVLDRPEGTVEVKRKGGKYKTAYIGPEFYEFFAEYLKTRTDIADHSQPLFLTTHGNRISRTQVYKALAHKQKQLNLATGPHALRHTFVSEAEKIGGAGVSRDLANHKTIRITNRYTHTNEQQRMETVKQLKWT